jgi:hypothetical protein
MTRGTTMAHNWKYSKAFPPLPGFFVLYLLKFCDARVSKCYGCGHPIKVSGLTNIPPSNLLIVAKLCQEYRASTSKRCFHQCLLPCELTVYRQEDTKLLTKLCTDSTTYSLTFALIFGQTWHIFIDIEL